MTSLEQFATAPDAPAPWRAIARRVQAGEFTWQDVADGRLCTDEGFLAAVDSTIQRYRERLAAAETGSHTGWRTSRDDEPDYTYLELA